MSDDDFVTYGFLKDALQSVPPGTIIAFLGTDVPAGFLLCNGGTIQRSQYPNLVGPLGSVPACAGDGSTTLVLPNLNDRFIEFSTTLSKIGTLVEPGLPNISGGFNANNGVAHGSDNYFFADGAFSCTGSSDPARPGNAGGSGGGGRIKMSASGSSSLYGRSSTVQPKSIRILPLIKF